MSPFHRIESGSRTIGFIAIDSTVGGRARGGLRISQSLSEEEIRSAARAMTLKYGFLGLPQGGAKAGVFGDPDAPEMEKRRLLGEFARAAEPILRTRAYVPDADIGTTADGIRTMMQDAGFRVGPREWRTNRSGAYTAESCAASADALLAATGSAWPGLRVAIEGFGKVGSELARLVSARGARVVAVSTSRGALFDPGGLDVAALAARAARERSTFASRAEGRSQAIPREALLELDLDLLLPCAGPGSVHAGNAARVRARAICAGANDPVTLEAERSLAERGVPYPPDFVTNCGGVLGGTLEFAGVAPDRVEQIVAARARAAVGRLLERAAQLAESPRSLAERDALARHAEIRRREEHPTLGQRCVSLAIDAYRRGWIPRRPVALIAARYLEGRVA